MLKPFIIEMKDREIVKNITPIKDPEIKCAYDNVYPPADDTYLIIDYFKKRLTNEYFDGLDMETIKNIVEIGTGTGIIAIFLQLLTKKYIKFKPKIYASDILQESIDCAKINQGLNNIDNQITLIKSNLFESFPKSLSHSFNIIIFNPPYLPSSELVEQNEEKKAIDRSWNGGTKGVEIFSRFLEDVKEFMHPKGCSIYYISSSRVNLEELSDIIEKNGFSNMVINKKHVFFEDIILNKLNLLA